MDNWIRKVNMLDISLFDAITSQTSEGDRRALLAVQRTTADKHKEYVYLEIGSHLGGSIQPHLFDDRCKKIYSIDSRPFQQPDDRSPGCIAYYDNNSTQRMIQLLSKIGHGDIMKIECFDVDASVVDPENIKLKPQIIFIDGEHTYRAVFSDFIFCNKVIDNKGTILFHDLSIVYSAIMDIIYFLDRQNRYYVAMRVKGDVFGIFFDPDKILSDQFLADSFNRNRFVRRLFWMEQRLIKILPLPLFRMIKWMIIRFKYLIIKFAWKKFRRKFY